MKNNQHAYQNELKSINQTMKYDGMERIYLLQKIVVRLVSDRPKTTVIRICGTNGKGSTTTMISNILQANDSSVGVFTSPYIFDPLEQIQINGAQLDQAQFLQAEQTVKRHVAALHLDFKTAISEFESWFLIAVQAFLDHQVDYMLLECGMGGQFDATNAIDHSDYSLFTQIGLDHFKFLGDTLEAIATTKVKMIRPHEQVISYTPQRKVVEQIINKEVVAKNARLAIANDIELTHLQFDRSRLQYHLTAQVDGQKLPLQLNLSGDFQLNNVKTVIKWWQVFNMNNEQQISAQALAKGIANSQMLGRFSSLRNGWIVDGAHNRDAIRAFVDSVNDYFASEPKLIIVGFLADKEVQYCVHELQRLKKTTFITITPDNHDRALSGMKLAHLFEQEPAIQNGINQVTSADCLDTALQVLQRADQHYRKLVVGSFYTIKAVIQQIERES